MAKSIVVECPCRSRARVQELLSIPRNRAKVSRRGDLDTEALPHLGVSFGGLPRLDSPPSTTCLSNFHSPFPARIQVTYFPDVHGISQVPSTRGPTLFGLRIFIGPQASDRGKGIAWWRRRNYCILGLTSDHLTFSMFYLIMFLPTRLSFVQTTTSPLSFFVPWQREH